MALFKFNVVEVRPVEVGVVEFEGRSVEEARKMAARKYPLGSHFLQLEGMESGSRRFLVDWGPREVRVVERKKDGLEEVVDASPYYLAVEAKLDEIARRDEGKEGGDAV